MNDVKKEILNRVKRVALGNSDRGLKELASDLLNEYGNSPKAVKNISEMTFLAPATVRRVLDCEENYSPMSDTLERCLKAMNCELTATEVEISTQYQNRPKSQQELDAMETDDPSTSYKKNPLKSV